MARTVALIVAAGLGERFGGALPKQYRLLAGRPLLRHAAGRLAGHPRIDGVHIVVHPDHGDLYGAALDGLALPPPVAGGASRQESVRRGLEALADDPPDRVLIHDAARPLVPPAVVDRVLDALDEAPGAVPALPVADTLARGDARDALLETVPRDRLWRVQTPQGFGYHAILEAHRAAARQGGAYTDDAGIARAAGLEVRLVRGTESLAKVTTEEDLERLAATLAPAGETRVGSGFDVHRFGPGDHVMLCGVPVPHDRGLVGHSDADVGLHAATDALLGALGAGDIGEHFPPTELRWRGADSSLFLRHAAALLAQRGGTLLHLDVTLICERPKVSPHRAAMAARLADILAVPAARISVKATTTEGLGFTGRREGIAAQATATIRLTTDEP